MGHLDADWRKAHPLPPHDRATDKNSRGRVLLVGGSEKVPGGALLTGEAVLRTGAGKIQIATVRSVAIPLGIAFPEAGVIPLPADGEGEIAADACAALEEALEHCDTLLFGPAMRGGDDNAALLHGLLAAPRDELTVLLDAAAIVCAGRSAEVIAAHAGRIVMTPHHGEMAALTGLPIEEIAAHPERIAAEAARRFGAVIALKAERTIIAAPDGALLRYRSDCAGLATAGSGDVLAGVIAALLARGADPVAAAGWGVWLHGEAGQTAAGAFGPTGFLARDLLRILPRLLAAHATG